MAKLKAKAKKVVNKVLDKTELDDKLIAEYNEAKASGLLDKIKCYVCCFGGYLIAVGAGCYFSKNFCVGLALLAVAGFWGGKATCNCKPCKGVNETCC